MEVLLDECLPRKFKNTLIHHDCLTVPEAGLAGKKNGELLLLAESSGFQVFLTVDHGIAYQQSLYGRKIAVIIFEGEVEPTCRPPASCGFVSKLHSTHRFWRSEDCPLAASTGRRFELPRAHHLK